MSICCCCLQTDRGGFVQPVSGETRRCGRGGPVADKPPPPAPHGDERKPLAEVAGSNEGMFAPQPHVKMGSRSDSCKLSFTLCWRNSGFDTEVSAAPCLLGDELQRSTDSSTGLLAYSVPPAAQQGAACQRAVHSESGYQPRTSLAHSSLLPL